MGLVDNLFVIISVVLYVKGRFTWITKKKKQFLGMLQKHLFVHR